MAGHLARQLLVGAAEVAGCGASSTRLLQHVQGWSMTHTAQCHTKSGPGSKSMLHTAAEPVTTAQVLEELNEMRLGNVDPFALVKPEVNIVSERLRHSMLSSIPALSTAATYFFKKGVPQGKQLRPTLALLMANSLSSARASHDMLQVDLRPPSEHPPEARRQHQRIAEISELIHVASLLHDDVIDEASTRRGILSLNASMGNKVAILAGDYLLARTSVTLAALRNTEIVELFANVLECLVSGEIMQLTASQDQLLDLEHYLQKTYCKTASLMANSCRSVAVLAGHTPEVCDLAWNYGRHLGLAFQVVDDVLDLTASSSMLGKPALNDMKSGLSTAPVLFAAQELPELQPLVLRKFKQDGDVAKAVELLSRSQGIQRARDLAAYHCRMAAEMVLKFPEAQSEEAVISRQALLKVTQKVLDRQK